VRIIDSCEATALLAHISCAILIFIFSSFYLMCTVSPKIPILIRSSAGKEGQ